MTALDRHRHSEVRADVLKTLGIKNARGFVVTFNRPNIEMTVKSKKSYRDASIGGVACRPVRRPKSRHCSLPLARRDRTARSRHQRRTEKTRARERLSPGPAAVVYNAGMSTSARVASQNAWMCGDAACAAPPSPSGWASIRKTFGTWCTTPRPSRSRGCTRRSGAREETETGGGGDAVRQIGRDAIAADDVDAVAGVRRADRLRRANRCCARWRATC